MHSWFVLCFFMSMVALSRARVGFDGAPGPHGKTGLLGPPGNTGLPSSPGKTGLTGPSGQKGTVTVKYCPISKTITTFLKQFRNIGLRGASGARGLSGQSGSLMTYNWIYNCLHVGMNFQQMIFELPIYQCCKTCEFPDFSHCMRSHSRSTVEARCNSEALRCIARCISNKGGNGNAGRPGPPGPPGPQKCIAKRKRMGTSYCLERSCLYV